MDFSLVIGHNHLKKSFTKSLEKGRIAHAQLFVGATGYGLLPMALAYANAILTSAYKNQPEAFNRCQKMVAQLTHPDLHFVYPVNTTAEIKKNPISSNFIEIWRAFVLNNPYGSYFEWLLQLGIENKQGNISVKEADDISKKLSLKAYEGGYKVMIIWMAENMNTECANKILKLVEEPSPKTVLILLAEKEEQIISTIRSRCQTIYFSPLTEAIVAEALETQKGLSAQQAKGISKQCQGDYNRALQLISENNEDRIFEAWFITWVRTAFLAKGNKQSIRALIDWSESLAAEGREVQKKFLTYCIELFRHAFLNNFNVDHLLFLETEDKSFNLSKFSPYVHTQNIFEIVEALENAQYHIERNGNAKLIFTDLSISLTKLIHKKETA